jgi:hypothetical protein
VGLALFLAADVVLRANLSHNNLFIGVTFAAFAVASAVASVIAGAVIVVRQPRNVIGWLLLAVPLWRRSRSWPATTPPTRW